MQVEAELLIPGSKAAFRGVIRKAILKDLHDLKSAVESAAS